MDPVLRERNPNRDLPVAGVVLDPVVVEASERPAYHRANARREA